MPEFYLTSPTSHCLRTTTPNASRMAQAMHPSKNINRAKQISILLYWLSGLTPDVIWWIQPTAIV